jgi:hypothetical protein
MRFISGSKGCVPSPRGCWAACWKGGYTVVISSEAMLARVMELGKPRQKFVGFVGNRSGDGKAANDGAWKCRWGRRVNVMNNSGPKTVRSKAKWHVLYVQQTSWLSDVMGCDGM